MDIHPRKLATWFLKQVKPTIVRNDEINVNLKETHAHAPLRWNYPYPTYSSPTPPPANTARMTTILSSLPVFLLSLLQIEGLKEYFLIAI
jgi:hypothetical protein